MMGVVTQIKTHANSWVMMQKVNEVVYKECTAGSWAVQPLELAVAIEQLAKYHEPGLGKNLHDPLQSFRIHLIK